MSNTNDLSNRINDAYSKLSKGQKRLATYITDNYDKAVFLTAAKLGEVVGVSESTVVRFATHLGYKGYPEFQSALEELVRNKLNSIQRMEVTYGRISQSKILETVLNPMRTRFIPHWKRLIRTHLNSRLTRSCTPNISISSESGAVRRLPASWLFILP